MSSARPHASLIDLTGKSALVTGGSRGIGAATALLLARAGASVGITYRTRRADAERVLEKLREIQGGTNGYDPLALGADLTSRNACDEVVREAKARLGRLDVLVANAGIWKPDDVSVEKMTDDRWSQTVGVNLHAVFYVCRAALGVMEPGGRIVIVSSTAGQRGEAYHSDYAATKGATIAFVKSVAIEVAPEINVNAVAPGWVDTEMCTETFARDGGAGRREIEAGIPLGRVASPDDIAGPILFLCSDLGRHVTGEVLNVNGGAVLCG